MIALLLESTVLNLVLAKGALTDLNMKIQFLKYDNKLNPVIHLHLLPRFYSLPLRSIMGYEILSVQFYLPTYLVTSLSDFPCIGRWK